MSLEIIGFLDCLDNFDADKIQELVHPLGFSICDKVELDNFFPIEVMPSVNSIVFRISDTSDKINATYLIDGIDYVEDTYLHGLSCLWKERVCLLANSLKSILNIKEVYRICVSISDSSQIEEIKYLDSETLMNQIFFDFEELSPPDILYVIKRHEDNRSDRGQARKN